MRVEQAAHPPRPGHAEVGGGREHRVVVGVDMRFLRPEDEHAIRAGDYKLEGTTAILVNPEGEVLVQRKDNIPTIRYPDYWRTPGGVVEPGETPEQTIRRGLEEELGYVVGEVAPYGRIIDAYRNLINVFLAPIDQLAEDLVLGEGREVRFFGQYELPEKLTPHAREILVHFFSAGSGARDNRWRVNVQPGARGVRLPAAGVRHPDPAGDTGDRDRIPRDVREVRGSLDQEP